MRSSAMLSPLARAASVLLLLQVNVAAQQLTCPTPPTPPPPSPAPVPTPFSPTFFDPCWEHPQGCPTSAPNPTPHTPPTRAPSPKFPSFHEEPCGTPLVPCRRNLRKSISGITQVKEAPSKIITMSRSCVIFAVEAFFEDGSYATSWACKLDERDAVDGEDPIIELPDIELDKSTFVSGQSTFFIPNLQVDLEEGDAILPSNALEVAQFGSLRDTATELFPEHGQTRRRLSTTGVKLTLVVRCSTDSGSPTDSKYTISDNVFGTTSDTSNLKSNLEECSYNQLCILPASGSHIWHGVVDVTWGKNSNGESSTKVHKKCVKEARKKLGHGWLWNKLEDKYDLVMVVLPTGTLLDGSTWRAYAYVGGYLSAYNDKRIRYVFTQQHEVGHNLGLEHAGQNGDEYGDKTGAMGYTNSRDDNDKCYNGPHSWYFGWYQNRHQSLSNTLTNPVIVDLTGVDNWTSGSGDTIILRVYDGCCYSRNYYVMYNHKVGINVDSGEDQKVMVVRGGSSPSRQSWLLAELSQGDDYVMNFFECGGGYDDRVDDYYTADDDRYDSCSDPDVRITALSISGLTATIEVEKA